MPSVTHPNVTLKVTPMNNSPFPVPQDSQHLSVLYKQLVISLKFHHGQTLCQLPRDLALQAINEVWESCNSKPVAQSGTQSGTQDNPPHD
jgi:hypothetical protein